MDLYFKFEKQKELVQMELAADTELRMGKIELWKTVK